MQTRLLRDRCAETELRAGRLVPTAPSQTESKQPPVCVSPPAVWPWSVKQGPTRWASSCLDPPSLPDRLASVLHFTGLRCPSSVSPERPKNISHAPIKHVFSEPGLTLVRKPPPPRPPLPNPRCSVSRGQPVTGKHISKTARCQDSFDKSVMTRCFGSRFRFSTARAASSSHIYKPTHFSAFHKKNTKMLHSCTKLH